MAKKNLEWVVQSDEKGECRVVVKPCPGKVPDAFTFVEYDWENPDPGHPCSTDELREVATIDIQDQYIPQLISALKQYLSYKRARIKDEAERTGRYLNFLKEVEEK